MKIATHLSYRPNFVNYMFREDMISDGIENCVQYIHRFDVERTNPFAYFTQIVYYAFLRRIAKEKRQNELKERMIDNFGASLSFTESEHSDGHNDDYIMEHAKTKHDDFMLDGPKPKKKKKGFHKPVKVEALENFMT